MAEPGRRARWTAALVAAPGAAAVLAGATAWAAHTRPATANGGSSPVVRAPVPADATTLRSVQQSAAANRRELERLQQQLTGLRRQLSSGQTTTRPAPRSTA